MCQDLKAALTFSSFDGFLSLCRIREYGTNYNCKAGTKSGKEASRPWKFSGCYRI
jgi:hypothetical protein